MIFFSPYCGIIIEGEKEETKERKREGENSLSFQAERTLEEFPPTPFLFPTSKKKGRARGIDSAFFATNW